MASVGVRLNAQLGAEFWALVLRFIFEPALWSKGTEVGLPPGRNSFAK